MDSPIAPRGSFEDEGQKLKACEENLRRYHQLALAGRLISASMHEVNNRLAALTNLIFLARATPDCSLLSVEYLDEADSQLRSLGEITSRSLAFIRLDLKVKKIDLVDLATSALRLHHEQISQKRINVQTRSSESASRGASSSRPFFLRSDPTEFVGTLTSQLADALCTKVTE
jgi:signal transduction histidine kinase